MKFTDILGLAAEVRGVWWFIIGLVIVSLLVAVGSCAFTP